MEQNGHWHLPMTNKKDQFYHLFQILTKARYVLEVTPQNNFDESRPSRATSHRPQKHPIETCAVIGYYHTALTTLHLITTDSYLCSKQELRIDSMD